jgi:hypothetical protein
MKQVSDDFKTKKKKANNYKSKINNALKVVKIKVSNQIREWDNFIVEKHKHDKLKENINNQELKRGKTSISPKENKFPREN